MVMCIVAKCVSWGGGKGRERQRVQEIQQTALISRVSLVQVPTEGRIDVCISADALLSALPAYGQSTNCMPHAH